MAENLKTIKELDKRRYCTLATALYRLVNFCQTDADREVVTKERETFGDQAVRDQLLQISSQPQWQTGDLVEVGRTNERGIVIEVDCSGSYWHQRVTATTGDLIDEIFSPAYTVKVRFGNKIAFCQRQEINAASQNQMQKYNNA